MIIELMNPETCKALRQYADDLHIRTDDAAEEIIFWYLFKAGDQINELAKLNKPQAS